MRLNLSTAILVLVLISVGLGWIIDRASLKTLADNEADEMRLIHERQLRAQLVVERSVTSNRILKLSNSSLTQDERNHILVQNLAFLSIHYSEAPDSDVVVFVVALSGMLPKSCST